MKMKHTRLLVLSLFLLVLYPSLVAWNVTPANYDSHQVKGLNQTLSVPDARLAKSNNLLSKAEMPLFYMFFYNNDETLNFSGDFTESVDGVTISCYKLKPKTSKTYYKNASFEMFDFIRTDGWVWEPGDKIVIEVKGYSTKTITIPSAGTKEWDSFLLQAKVNAGYTGKPTGNNSNTNTNLGTSTPSSVSADAAKSMCKKAQKQYDLAMEFYDKAQNPNNQMMWIMQASRWQKLVNQYCY
jgi:hypothetical protein